MCLGKGAASLGGDGRDPDAAVPGRIFTAASRRMSWTDMGRPNPSSSSSSSEEDSSSSDSSLMSIESRRAWLVRARANMLGDWKKEELEMLERNVIAISSCRRCNLPGSNLASLIFLWTIALCMHPQSGWIVFRSTPLNSECSFRTPLRLQWWLVFYQTGLAQCFSIHAHWNWSFGTVT